MWALIGIISAIIFVVAGIVDLYLAWSKSKMVSYMVYQGGGMRVDS